MRLIVSLLVAVSLYSCGETATATSSTLQSSATTSLENAEAPDIRITLRNAEELNGALLIGQFMDQQFKVDSAVVAGNTLTFSRAEPYQYGHYYAYLPSGSGVQLLIGEDQTFSISGDMTDFNATVQVEGSEDNRLLYEAMAYEAGLQPRFEAIGNERATASPGTPEYEDIARRRGELVLERISYLGKLFEEAPNSLFTAFKRAGQNPPLNEFTLPSGAADEQRQVADFRYHFWDGVNFNDPRLLRTPVIKNKLTRYIKELTPQNADSINVAADRLLAKTNYRGKFYEFFANWITLQYEPGKSTVMDAEAIHVHMIQNYFTRERAVWSDSMTVYGLQQRAETMAHSLVGQQAPDITVPGLDGTGKRLYDLKKPFIAVFMFNPECEHCIEQSPKLTAAYQRHKDLLDVYAIALDTEPAKWKAFVDAYDFGAFTNVFDPTNRSIFKTFYVDNTPELYLLDAERKIVSKNIKVDQLSEAIELAQSR